jgi:hypothetical protein
LTILALYFQSISELSCFDFNFSTIFQSPCAGVNEDDCGKNLSQLPINAAPNPNKPAIIAAMTSLLIFLLLMLKSRRGKKSYLIIPKNNPRVGINLQPDQSELEKLT